jgi:hypothetical protein
MTQSTFSPRDRRISLISKWPRSILKLRSPTTDCMARDNTINAQNSEIIDRDRRKSRQKSAKITANFYTHHEKHGNNTVSENHVFNDEKIKKPAFN